MPLTKRFNFSDQTTFARRDVHTGLGQQAQQAVATAVIYRITEGKGDQGTILVADAEKSLLSTGDALIANATDQAFGAAIQSVFTDPSITVTASDVAPAVETALLRGGGIASAAVSGMAGVTSTYCPQVADVLSQAKILAVNSGNGQAFDEAINTWSQIASTDSSSPASKLFACAPVTPGGSSSAGRK